MENRNEKNMEANGVTMENHIENWSMKGTLELWRFIVWDS